MKRKCDGSKRTFRFKPGQLVKIVTGRMAGPDLYFITHRVESPDDWDDGYNMYRVVHVKTRLDYYVLEKTLAPLTGKSKKPHVCFNTVVSPESIGRVDAA